MSTDNWIMVLSAVIVAVGWFVTGYLNRLQDISQKRLEYRLEALKSFLPVWFSIQRNNAPFTQPDFLQKLETARSNFQLYGYQDEINLMERFIVAIEQNNLENANAALSELVPLVRQQIRKQIGLNA
jgi:hypothetical protein